MIFLPHLCGQKMEKKTLCFFQVFRLLSGKSGESDKQECVHSDSLLRQELLLGCDRGPETALRELCEGGGSEHHHRSSSLRVSDWTRNWNG